MTEYKEKLKKFGYVVINLIDKGIYTFQIILKTPAPSIFAASSNSFGIDMKVCRNKKIPNPEAI